MKKTLLIFCGILIALISLEIVLQTTSFIILRINKLNINKTIKLAKNKNEITILCIGESTTYEQYPKNLQRYLDLYLDKKSVKVIDCGIPGTNLNNTLKNLDNYISDYNPDIVISMMGINDAQRQDVKIYNKKYRLKTLELLRIIKKHITADLYAENLNYNINDIMLEYIKSGKPPVILESMLKKDKNNPEILTALISVYRILKDYESTEKYANQYIENYLGKFDADVPFFLTDIYIQQKKYPNAEKLISKIISDKAITDTFIDDYICRIIESYIKFAPDEKKLNLYNMLLENKVQTKILDNFYIYLSKKLKQPVKRYDYENKFKNIVSAPFFSTKEIKESYLSFAKKIIEKNIIYICMGYPTMPIETFKDFFKNSKYEDKIIFVSNEYNFKKRLAKMPYFALFIDNFAGTFGHCTNFGNKLIAKNVGDVILKIIDI